MSCNGLQEDDMFHLFPETNDVEQSDDSEENKTASTLDIRKQPDDVRKQSDDAQCPTESAWKNMADRPLPVPVENESYYMDIERGEAENLLRGLPDGTFVLRPSSQVIINLLLLMTGKRFRSRNPILLI